MEVRKASEAVIRQCAYSRGLAILQREFLCNRVAMSFDWH
jgi:hypothetical protein